ncbi:MAG TPA: sigma-70 family RNA polymerase sigma factor [Pirellulales bacterium]|nr:sigma-70 family RNA polymerase sigma factor [Pirellulales bacterium]
MSGTLEGTGDAGQSAAISATDRSLLRAISGGSDDAAAKLYRRYASRLRALAKAQSSHDLARREDVDDIVQSVFGSFFRAANQGLYDVPAGEDLWKLFVVIAMNKIRAKGNYHRAAKRDIRLTTGSEGLAHAGAAELASDDEAVVSLQLAVEEALAQLPPLTRQMALLRMQGYEIGEIGRATSRSYRTVERSLKGFRELLAGMLHE